MYNLYIDPGTGGMLFTILIGILGFAIYAFRIAWIKIKFLVTKGKTDKLNAEKIPILIYGEDSRYWQVFKPVCDEFEKRGVDVVYWTTTPDDPVLNMKYDHIKFAFAGEGNKAYAKLNLVNAGIVLSTTPGLDVYQWKRSKFVDYYIHMFHSTGSVGGYRMFGFDFYDAILLTGEYQVAGVRELEKKRHEPAKELEIVGIPYFDDLKDRLESAEKKDDKETKTVLLAPSWGPNSIFVRFGDRIFDELLKTDYNIIVRPHPQSFISEKDLISKLQEKYPDSDRLKWDSSKDNFDTLNRSDILISDYSGVFYDFALVFDKPILYADVNYDSAIYDNYWLDGTPWIFAALPKLGMKITDENIGQIGEVIDKCINSPEFAEGRKTVREQTWANIGLGAEKTVDYILKKQESLAKAAEEKKESKPREKKLKLGLNAK